jgi:hypothetical protein
MKNIHHLSLTFSMIPHQFASYILKLTIHKLSFAKMENSRLLFKKAGGSLNIIHQ